MFSRSITYMCKCGHLNMVKCRVLQRIYYRTKRTYRGMWVRKDSLVGLALVFLDPQTRCTKSADYISLALLCTFRNTRGDRVISHITAHWQFGRGCRSLFVCMVGLCTFEVVQSSVSIYQCMGELDMLTQSHDQRAENGSI